MPLVQSLLSSLCAAAVDPICIMITFFECYTYEPIIVSVLMHHKANHFNYMVMVLFFNNKPLIGL